VFAPDDRPGADTFVYCKGCGTPLEGRARLAKPKASVDTMMCDSCIEIHGHRLMPKPGSPTFCYRCGGPEDLFESPGISPTLYHVCPRCLPERVARYRSGDFETPMRVPGAEIKTA
jgi:NMD protein affecting ribosome stability and mRNA decay